MIIDIKIVGTESEVTFKVNKEVENCRASIKNITSSVAMKSSQYLKASKNIMTISALN
jgi:hypothetical protein